MDSPPAASQNGDSRRDWRRWTTNAVIVSFVALVAIDTLPIPGRLPQAAYQRVESLLDVTGLWQGRWDLFAPQVDQQNHHIEIQLRDRNSDRILSSWRSTDWEKLSCFEVFLHQREVEYYDRIRSNANGAAWPALADYARRNHFDGVGSKSDSVVEIFDVSTPVPPPRAKTEPTTHRQKFYPPAPSPDQER